MTTIGLEFAGIECLGCGEKRVRGQVCPTCGATPDPREVDAHTARRRRVAGRALSILEGPEPESGSPTPFEVLRSVWGELYSWLDEFLDTLAEAGESPDGEERLFEAVAKLRSIEARVKGVPRLRPWVVLLEPLGRVLDDCTRIARRYLDAFAASVQFDSQRAAAEGQRAIDAAGVSAESVVPLLARWERLLETVSVEDALTVLFEEAYEESGAESIMDFDRAGHGLYRKATGNGDCAPGLGAFLQLARVQVGTTGDEAKFWTTVSDLVRLLRRRPGRLRAVLLSEEWRGDFAEDVDKGYASAVHCQASITASKRNRDEVRALLTLGLDLVEGRGGQLVATLLAVEGRKPYEALRKRDAGDLLRRCEQKDLGRFVDGLDRTVRVARAHEDYRVVGDAVLLGGRRGPEQRLSVDELVDRVLAGAESALALEVALRCAAGTLGIEVPDPDLIDDLELPPEDAVTLRLASAGWSEIEVELCGDVVRATGRGDTSMRAVLRTAGPVFPCLPTTCETLELTVRADDGQVHAVGPVEPFRRWSRCEDELESELLRLEVWHRWTFDGRPVYPREFVRQVFARQAAWELMDAEPETMRALRKLIDAARRSEDPELEECLGAYLRQLRSRELGLPSAPRIEDAKDKLLAWMRQDLADPMQGEVC